MKKILSLFLCLAVLLPVFCFPVAGETEPPTEPVTEDGEQPDTGVLETLKVMLGNTTGKSEEQRIRQQILRTHIASLEGTGHKSLGGRCGLQVSWELYLLGINQYLATYHGKDHFDVYSAMDTTSGGHTVRAYSAQKYSMLDALKLITKNGTLDVYNVMVGFEKTHTEAGALYGHVCFIHGILDGMVYAVEGFSSRFGTIEGQPIVVSMEEFAGWFESWAQYEGLVYFGTKSELDNCVYYPADLFVQCQADTQLLTQPDREHSEPVRVAAMGERLHVTGMYENVLGEVFYRIADDEDIAYAPAERLSPVLFNYESVTYEEPALPELLEVGQRFKPGGKVKTDLLQFERVRLVITDAAGENLLDAELMQEGKACDLGQSEIGKKVDTGALDTGIYTYSIYADTQNNYFQDGQQMTDSQTLCVASARFAVGLEHIPLQPQVQPKQQVQGWSYEQGKWYYYEDGQPRTGWLGDNGHDYYLDETGAAMTGWVQINGKMRYFSQTGAMRTGWLDTPEGSCYMLRNGVMATGWRNVDGSRYCFDEQGIMRCNGWTQIEDRIYYFYPDGKTATGWVTMETGVYSFHADGYLLAKRVEQEGKIQIVSYDGTWTPEDI